METFKISKDEIKKALKCCCYDSGSEANCSDCAYHNVHWCNDMLCKDALNLITEQEKEINNLKADYARLQELFTDYQFTSDKEIVAQKKQAIKEFTERR